MTAEILAEMRIMKAESFRAQKYLLNGITHIGFGFNVDAGISRYSAACLMIGQVKEIVHRLEAYYWFTGLDDVRASVLIEMMFNLGPAGLLHFPKMLAAIAAKDWQGAARECLDSDAARNPQLTARYQGFAAMLATGAYSAA